MATQHLDLDEQEQIAQLKHFWSQYGNLISWILIAVFGSLAAYNGWNYWQRHQASGASALYDSVESAVKSGDVTRVERALGDMRERYGSTIYAAQAGMLAARSFADAGKPDLAKAALQAVADKSSDTNYQALSRLDLAGLQADAKEYDAALKTLASVQGAHYAALVADRKGDIYLLQGQKDQARAEYEKAYAGMGEEVEYKRLVEAKLNTLGVNLRTKSAETKKS